VELTLDDQRIYDRAAVVNGHIFLQLDIAGRWIDFDNTHVRAKRPDQVWRIEVRNSFETVFDAFG